MSLADEVRIRFTPFCHSTSDRSERTNATYVQKDTVDRIAKFLDGRESTAHAKGVLDGRDYERERILKIIDKQTRHHGKTHYAGVDCWVCDLYVFIEGAAIKGEDL